MTMICKRHLRTFFKVFEWWLLFLGKIRWYHTVFVPDWAALALSMVPLPSTTTGAITSCRKIRSTCHCGELVIDVSLHDLTEGDGKKGLSAVSATNCHCRGCRRYHTNAFASFLETDVGRITIRRGRDRIGKFLSDCDELGPVERWFCSSCSSKLLSVPLHLSSSVDNPAGDHKGDDIHDDTGDTTMYDKKTDSTNHKRLPKKGSTCLVNLGPVVEDNLPPELRDSWKEQLDLPENNHHMDREDAIWARAFPSRTDDDAYVGLSQALATPLQWSGGCACGACRYEFTLTYPTELQHCYCHLCRELSGSPFMTWIPVENEDFQWARGMEETNRESTLTSSPSSTLELVRTTPFGSRHICGNCQSVMSIVYDEQPDHIWPCAGSLDDATLPKDRGEIEKCLSRVCHICCRHHPTWLKIRNDGMERIPEAC